MVCVGMVAPATLVVVDELPAWNTGATWKHVAEFISDDAAIVAILLKKWGVEAGLIATTLGDDAPGHRAARQLREMGILGEFHVSREVETPYELCISDASGGRTYLWRREPKVLATLETADLSLIRGARAVYADWYDGGHTLPALREATRLRVPVFFNFEHGHEDPELVGRYAPFISTCQAVTDAAQRRYNAREVAVKLRDAGVPTALVTMAERGCLAATDDTCIRVHAPGVKVIDGCGSGATFSAGYMFGLLEAWDLEERLRFGVAAASLGCTEVGPVAFPVHEITGLAATLDVERGAI